MGRLIVSLCIGLALLVILQLPSVSSGSSLPPPERQDAGTPPPSPPHLLHHLNRLPLLTRDADLIVVAEVGEIRNRSHSELGQADEMINQVSVIHRLRVTETLKGRASETIYLTRLDPDSLDSAQSDATPRLGPETSAVFFLHMRVGRRIGTSLYNPFYFAYHDIGILTIDKDRAYPLEPRYFRETEQDFYHTASSDETYFELEALREYIVHNIEVEPRSQKLQFSDIDNSPHKWHIQQLADEGVTRGCGTETDPDQPDLRRFCPNRTITRGELATFLARALDVLATERDFFTDDEGHTHERSINQITDSVFWPHSSITTGCDSSASTDRPTRINHETKQKGRYCPDRTVTRSDMASFLGPQISGPSPEQDIFQDDDQDANEEHINRIATIALTQGCNPPLYTNFCPDREITRGEMATLLIRYLDYRKSQKGGTPRLPPEVFDHQIVPQIP